MSLKKPRGKIIRALSPTGSELVDLESFSGVRPLEKKFKSKSLPGKAPGVRRMRESEYSQLMKSKQIIRHYYGLKEGQFKRIYDHAAQSKGSTGENLLTSLELRLDSIVYRAGFAATRAQARQIVSHKHFLVDGQPLNIPSYRCRPGQVITVAEKSRSADIFKAAAELAKQKETVQWLETDFDKLSAKIQDAPELDKLQSLFKVSHVVELYSK